MSKELSNRSEFFFEMEARDEQQMIKEYEGKVLKEITYKVQGQIAISYNGIKFIANKLGGIKVLPDSIKAEFIEKPEQMWVASVVVLNEKYGTQLPGAGEQPYMMLVKGELKPDPFARRKAISKATRNAVRAVIPEAMILKFLEDVEKGTDFNPPPTTEGIRREVESEFQEKKIVWDGDLSIPNMQAYLISHGFEGEEFKIRHDKENRTYIIDIAPWTEDFTLLKEVYGEMGFKYHNDSKKQVLRY